MTRPPSRTAARRRVVVALVVCAVLVALATIRLAAMTDPVRATTYAVLGLGSTAAVLLLARRAPGPGVAVGGALAMAAQALQPVPPVALLPFAVGVVIATASGARIWAIASVAVAYAVPLAALFLTDFTRDAARGFSAMVVLLIALGAGAFVRARRVREEGERHRRAEQQRAAIEEERLRIARELHDVLAHSLSSITVQAGVGLHLAPERPAAATEALETIRTASREALDEVRGVLGLLRDDAPAPLEPERGLDALPALVADARRTGARIDLVDDLQPRPSTPVQLALYRVVQEALTNARRHAPGSAVRIVLDRDGDAVSASVRDRGPGDRPVGAAREPIPGNGITGMRERAAALGGTLALLPRDDGLEVVVRLPTGGERP